MDERQLLSRIHGCLAGVACGDAMGMPTSMMSRAAVRNAFPCGITRFEAAPKGHPIHGGLVAGQVTDDTQQTLVVASSILEDGRVDPAGIARRLLAWAEGMDAFGSLLLGPSSLRALKAIKEGKSVEETGAFGDTNGASMRIAAVGMIHPGDLGKTVEEVALACRATHNTDIAIAGASAVACAIGAALCGVKSVDDLVNAALSGARLGLERGNPWIGASIEKRTRLALTIVRSGRPEEEILQDLYDIIGAGVAITETVPVSLALVCYAGGDPVRTILLAANLGGDADTIAATAGSIAGAYAGVTAFPADYLEKIECVNHLDLAGYAKRLASFAAGHLRPAKSN